MRELLLVRHGESEGNVADAAARRAQAETIDLPARDADVVLSSTGVEQSEAFGRALAALEPDRLPDHALCSPYVRAQQTLAVVLSTSAIELPTTLDERLRDRELGILDGLTQRGVSVRHPEEEARRRWLGKFYHRPPGGESWADVALRIRSLMADLDRGSSRRLLVVAHDAVIMLFRYVCEQLTEQALLTIAHDDPLRNLSVTQLVQDAPSQRWRAVAYNDVSHLEAESAPVTHHPGEHRGQPR
jgi:broad specificity phosphatase PhoE